MEFYRKLSISFSEAGLTVFCLLSSLTHSRINLYRKEENFHLYEVFHLVRSGIRELNYRRSMEFLRCEKENMVGILVLPAFRSCPSCSIYKSDFIGLTAFVNEF